MEEWEYWTGFLWANAEEKEAKEYLNQKWPNWNPPKYAPEAMIPELNKMGKNGWELISMAPVVASKDYLVAYAENTLVNMYFCVFKRRVQK